MKEEDDIQNEMKDLAPGFPVRKAMDAPEGYFEKFPGEVLNRWKKAESQSATKIIAWKRIISIAAVLTCLSIGGWWFLSKSSMVATNDFSAVEAYQYANENIDDFEPLLETEDIQVDESQLDVPKDAIEQYLIEETNGADPEDLF
ncbi:MAG: hypothetical protein ABIQ02_03645 [Saprospiraceae bacterium]